MKFILLAGVGVGLVGLGASNEALNGPTFSWWSILTMVGGLVVGVIVGYLAVFHDFRDGAE